MEGVMEVETQFDATLDAPVESSLVKAAQEADLIEGGRYAFQIESYEGALSTKEFFDEEGRYANPLYGKTIYNCRIRLTSKRDGTSKTSPFVTLDRPRTMFIKVTNAQVNNSRGELSTESKLFGQMAGVAASAIGSAVSVRMTLEYFKENMGEIHVTKSEERDTEDGKHWDACNFTREIKAYKP